MRTDILIRRNNLQKSQTDGRVLRAFKDIDSSDDRVDEEDKSLARRTESLDHQENGGGCCILQ